MRSPHRILAALALAAGALAATAPATILERLTPESSPLRLAACAGRLLGSGDCQLFLRAAAGWRHAGALSYTWTFMSSGGPRLELLHDGRRAGTLHPALAGWIARDIDLRMPLSRLPVGDWQPEGLMTISMPQLLCGWSVRDCSGRARIEVPDLRLARIGPEPVGSYALDIDLSAGGRMSGRLATLSGSLLLDGRLERSPGAGMRITGQARSGDGASATVRRLLADFGGRTGGDGKGGFVLVLPD